VLTVDHFLISSVQKSPELTRILKAGKSSFIFIFIQRFAPWYLPKDRGDIGSTSKEIRNISKDIRSVTQDLKNLKKHLGNTNRTALGNFEQITSHTAETAEGIRHNTTPSHAMLTVKLAVCNR
jgi:hypothetical protein